MTQAYEILHRQMNESFSRAQDVYDRTDAPRTSRKAQRDPDDREPTAVTPGGVCIFDTIRKQNAEHDAMRKVAEMAEAYRERRVRAHDLDTAIDEWAEARTA